MNKFKTLKISTVAVALSVLLVGCDSGGGGGDAAVPVPPTTPPVVTPKPPEVVTNLCRVVTQDTSNINYNFKILDPNAELANLKKFNPGTKTEDGADVTVFNTTHFPSETAEYVKIPTIYKQSKEQFRGMYVSTHFNLDIAASANAAEFKKQFDAILKEADTLKMNAIVFQVRANGDAWYKSEINPWSAKMSKSNKQNVSDLGDFDPLEYMISETHKNGMEFHAWINPFRAASSVPSAYDLNNPANIVNELKKSGQLSDKHFLAQERNYEKIYIDVSTNSSNNSKTGVLGYNPADKDVRDHVKASILELIKNYKDLDAIHFDDYFYLGTAKAATYKTQSIRTDIDGTFDYPIFKKEMVDTGKVPDTFENFEQWRRNNITSFIREVQELIHNYNDEFSNSIQFGIAPSGNWANKPTQLTGTRTRAGISYAGTIYADTKLWLEEGYVDYLAPQIYWPFAHPSAPYAEIATWWNNLEISAQSQLYIAHDLTQSKPFVSNSNTTTNTVNESWANPSEIPNQLRFNQTLNNVSGGIFWRHQYVVDNTTVKNDVSTARLAELKKTYWSSHAKPPAKKWLDRHVTNKPIDVRFDTSNSNATSFNKLWWKDDPNNKDTSYFIVYRSYGDPELIVANPNNIIAKIPVSKASDGNFYFDDTLTSAKQATYVVTAVDKAQLETEPAIAQLPKDIAEKNQITVNCD